MAEDAPQLLAEMGAKGVYLKPVTADTHAERHRLEGSVRRSISLIRVNTQLIDAETDAHLWADRFDSRRHQNRCRSTGNLAQQNRHGAQCALGALDRVSWANMSIVKYRVSKHIT